MLVGVGWPVGGRRAVVVTDSVIPNLTKNVDVTPRFTRHLIGKVCAEAKRVLHVSLESVNGEGYPVAVRQTKPSRDVVWNRLLAAYSAG